MQYASNVSGPHGHVDKVNSNHARAGRAALHNYEKHRILHPRDVISAVLIYTVE